MVDTLTSNADATPEINTRLWSTLIRNLTPYTPGEQPKHDNLCKLNTMKTLSPPPPKSLKPSHKFCSIKPII